MVTLYFLQSVECAIALQLPAILDYLATTLPTLTMYASSASFFYVHSHHLPSTAIYFLHVGHTTQQPSRWSECMSARSYINTQPHSGHVIFFSFGGSLPFFIILMSHPFLFVSTNPISTHQQNNSYAASINSLPKIRHP